MQLCTPETISKNKDTSMPNIAFMRVARLFGTAF